MYAFSVLPHAEDLTDNFKAYFHSLVRGSSRAGIQDAPVQLARVMIPELICVFVKHRIFQNVGHCPQET